MTDTTPRRIEAAALALSLVAVPIAPTQARPGVAADDAGPSTSVAHDWVDAALFAIRNDFARPTVHARNLYHLSTAMYDAWAVHDGAAAPLRLRPDAALEACRLTGAERERARSVSDPEAARRAAVGVAARDLLRERYRTSPNLDEVMAEIDRIAAEQGLDEGAEEGADGPGADLGARAAACALALGRMDASNEAGNHVNLDYAPINPPLDPTGAGNPDVVDPNRWQPLAFENFVDQSGNEADASEFLGAEWGRLEPFALGRDAYTEVTRDETVQPVWLDPGPPPRLGAGQRESEAYARHFALVALWSAHLDPADGVALDISPGAIGAAYPHVDRIADPLAQLDAYDALDGGMPAPGHPVNPATGEPYAPNVVPRGDYTRVLAEFWADGPDSETPPGHWFRIYNEKVGPHPALERRAGGRGEALDPLAFDVLAYLALGGAMHDAAIAAWSVKGAYDYPRPVSAIRHLANLDAGEGGLPLVPGRIERVGPDDPLAGDAGEHVGKVKLLAWRGPDAITFPVLDTAGVGWILAERWWPYQRPSFVSPPFAGYVSGHSTFSRAAAEVLEALTGMRSSPAGSPSSSRPRTTSSCSSAARAWTCGSSGRPTGMLPTRRRCRGSGAGSTRRWTTCRGGGWGPRSASGRGRVPVRCSRAHRTRTGRRRLSCIPAERAGSSSPTP